MTGGVRVWQFLGLTFVVSWGSWGFVLIRGGDHLSGLSLPFFVLGSFGPVIAAVALVARHRGERSARPRRLPVPAGLLSAAGVGATGALAAVIACAMLGRPIFDFAAAADYLHSFGNPAVFFLSYLLLGPISEEPGWRGYLLPRLRVAASPARVAVVFGPVWALWHLPLFLIPGTYQNHQGIFTMGGLSFLMGTIGLTVMISFAFERWGGLSAAIVMHFTANTLPVALGLDSMTVTVGDAVGKISMAVLLLKIWPTRPMNAPSSEEHLGTVHRSWSGA